MMTEEEARRRPRAGEARRTRRDDDEDVWTTRRRGGENERSFRRGASDVTSGRGVEGWEETARGRRRSDGCGRFARAAREG